MSNARRHLIIPFVLCTLLLIGAVVWQIIHSRRLAVLESRRQFLAREVQALRLVVTDLLDAETGQRGFLLTGKKSYLEPYARAHERLKAGFQSLLRLFQKESSRSRALLEIERNAALKMAELQDTVLLFARGDRAAAMKIVTTDKGKSYMDVLRGQLTGLITDLTDERTQIGVEAEHRIGQVRNGLIGMSVMICALLVLAYFLVSRAEQERSAFAARLEHAAHHDQLTGLPNRHYLKAHFGEVLRSAAAEHLRLALLYIDLDHFKSVNDTFGHEAGDKVLKDAAALMRNLAGENSTAIRLGGDEFALIYSPAPDETTLTQLADDLIRHLRSVTLDGSRLAGISASIGVALFPEHSESEVDLFDAADRAMYRAKNAGRARVVFADRRTAAQA